MKQTFLHHHPVAVVINESVNIRITQTKPHCHIHVRMRKWTHTYSYPLKPKLCLKQKFCNEWLMTSTAVKFCLKHVENFYTNKSPRSSNTIIHQVIYLLINHLPSHNSIKQELKLLEMMQYSEYPQKIKSTTISNNHTCVVTQDHQNICYILLTCLLLGTGSKPSYFKKGRNACKTASTHITI
jgi:hypothetical protein